ncbi:MAG: hypothetical protein M3Y87_05765 [Myxococcota bacterium]|nr:hypothetical protein [Myxococcota bacterium]
MSAPARTGSPTEGPRRLRWRLLRDQRGAVMAEAVIMLPVLILIWGIIMYIHLSFRDAQRNMATLRSDAWTHAFASCTSTAAAPTELTDAGIFDGESRSDISGLASALRFMSTSLFMIDEMGARRTSEIQRPETLGGGTRILQWELLMLCNERQREDADPLWEIWADLGISI